MEYNPEIHHRKSIRLKYYDYTTTGYYFITICTQNRKHILSKIKYDDCRGRVPPLPVNTKIGNEIEKTIKYIVNKYDYIEINDYIIMPNHIHLIIEKMGRDGTLPLQKIIGELKSFTTRRYNEFNRTQNEKLWQRNYYEHIIRNEKEYYKIIEYIRTNPLKWEEDKYYKEGDE